MVHKVPKLNYPITAKESFSNSMGIEKIANCKFANSRIMGWIIETQNFDIDVDRIKGVANVAADVLSRNPWDLEN